MPAPTLDGLVVVGVVIVAGLGVLMVALSMLDLVNTLVTTSTSYHRGWPSMLVTRATYTAVRGLARRMPAGVTTPTVTSPTMMIAEAI